MRMKKTVAVLLAALLISGCAPTPQGIETTPSPTRSQSRTTVEWAKYPTDAKRLIDEAQTTKDCAGLQSMFDAADNAGFVDEMKYIDEALELAGCY